MPPNILTSVIEHPQTIRSNKLNGKVHLGPATPLGLQELSKKLIDSQQAHQHAQDQIKVLVQQNAALQAEIIGLAKKEVRIRHAAYHDGLTGLPNRGLLQDRFRQALAKQNAITNRWRC